MPVHFVLPTARILLLGVLCLSLIGCGMDAATGSPVPDDGSPAGSADVAEETDVTAEETGEMAEEAEEAPVLRGGQSAAPAEGEGTTMLAIDLQDGFDGDTVIIRIDGEERFEKAGVTTMRLTGLADDTFRTQVEPGSATVEIAVPSRNLSESFTLDIAGDTYIGVSIQNGRLQHIIRDRPFGYG